MARPAQFNYVVQDLAAICAYQTTGAAGNLTINGTFVDQNALAVGVQRALISRSFARTVAINSSSDVSAVNFTVYGANSYGQTVSQTLSGPNASVVYTTKQFHSVTRVATDAAVASNTRVGIAGSGNSTPFLIDYFQNPINVGVGASVSGSLTYSLQQTDVNLDAFVATGGDVDTILWINIAGISGSTASQLNSATTSHGYLRFSVSGAVASAAMTGTLSQAGGSST